MNLQLPDAVATFFEVSNGADPARLAHCFTTDATVRDEGHAHQGLPAIQSWLREAQLKSAYRVEPLSASREGANVKVLARVVGDFPGSPAELEHAFRLAGDRIDALEIH